MIEIGSKSLYTSIYTFAREVAVHSAKIFSNGGSQAVRLPKEMRFSTLEVRAYRMGPAVVLYPEDTEWEVFMSGVRGFSSDFMSGGRQDQGTEQERPVW
jgi:antitoxin VapB